MYIFGIIIPGLPLDGDRSIEGGDLLMRSERYRLGGPPHPVVVTVGDNRDYIRVLLYSYYTTITGWGVLLNYR